MSSEIERLENLYGGADEPEKSRTNPVVLGTVTNEYERKLRRLGRKWHDILDGSGNHEYTSESEADLAVIDRMVKCNFTKAEVWLTIRSSARYQDRKKRKGEAHAEHLYEREIDKAFAEIIPFPPEPALPTIHLTSAQHESHPPQADPVAAYVRPVATPQVNPHSFIDKYIRYGQLRTDAPYEAHELMAITTLSALAGPGPRIPIATSIYGWSLVLWGMYVVNSTIGRKSTTVNLATDIIEHTLGRESMIQWEGSPQGLLQRLATRDGQTSVFSRDEYSGLIQQINRGGHMAGLAQMLIRAYDGGVLENIRTRKKSKDGKEEDDTDRVENPYLVTISASTFDTLISRATIDNVLDGFLTRFIFVTGAAEPRPLGRLTREIQDARSELLAHARGFVDRSQQTGIIDLDQDVLDAAWELEQRWIEGIEDTNRPDAVSAAMKRLSEAVLKTAALLAIDESNDDVFVTTEHFGRAACMGERWRICTLSLIESLGATEFNRNLQATLSTILRHTQGISISELYRTHRKLRKRDFDEMLETLVEQELIEFAFVTNENGKGRPQKMIFPFGAIPGQEAAE